ncbi:N-acetylmuramoyl-L-alanine amidase [Pseudoflavonifractor phocaeensis]|nr:N-acetylmuramoyl-L-alanine amidase [Pseudoflavonifractor phocaeensis]MBM6936986.1 N-acetylmuramoyl-L-alanine amidase [Pseudoflavonifractor phocaeensis]
MLLGLALSPPKSVTASQTLGASGPVPILDAGHGGEDGGAVSVTGVAESGINLAITRKLEWVLVLCGTVPEVLRREDVSLHDPEADTLREKKSSDLHNRAAAVEACPNGVLISIHQNSYPDSRYHGAQVFYGGGEGSALFAQQTQALLRQTLDPENSREAKPIPDTVYLMNHVTCPAILVECGFLSNPEEEQLLLRDDYQRKLALVLAGAWFQWTQQT